MARFSHEIYGVNGRMDEWLMETNKHRLLIKYIYAIFLYIHLCPFIINNLREAIIAGEFFVVFAICDGQVVSW